jgi:polyisoprenoid-binding protein YceI
LKHQQLEDLMTATTTVAAGLTAGTWTIDPVHSEVSFSVRHLMVSKVRGSFTKFSGTVTVGEDQLASAVEAEIDLSSIDTRDANRDGHLRSVDFFDTDTHPTMTYHSTGIRTEGDDVVVDGELTLHGVTKPVSLTLEFNGVSGDPWGGTRAGFSAGTEISRGDFGIEFNMPLEGGGVVVGDKVKVELEIEAVQQPATDATA